MIRKQQPSVGRVAVGATLSMALVLSGGAVANAAPQQVPAAPSQVAHAINASDLDQIEGLTALLQQIESIPDEVLTAGDEATLDWIDSNLGVVAGPAVKSPELGGLGGQFSTQASIPGCVGAIAVALAGVAFPAAKLLRIKKLADELGGVGKAVELLWGASFSYEKVQAAGGALAALGAELIGIAQIREQCFE